MVLTLQDLPSELLHLTLEYLPLSDLLSFARTSRSNHALSIQVLTSLDLAIFPRRIHSLLAFFDASNDDDDEDDDDEGEDESPISKYLGRYSALDKSLYQVGLTTSNSSRPSLSRSNTPPSLQITTDKERKSLHRSKSATPATPLSLRTAEITSQNTLANTILSSSSLSNLRNLTLRLYDLTSPALATTLATAFPTLHNLNLDFSHPYIHDTTLPAKYWKETFPSGSPIWNTFAGIGTANNQGLQMHSLRSLRLNRSGITSFQLRRWIEANPDLRELRLSLCRGVDNEFATWLANYITDGDSKLDVIRLTNCSMLELQTEADFDFVSRIACADHRPHELNFRACRNTNESLFLRLASGTDEQQSRWPTIHKLVSPNGVVVRHRGPSPHGSVTTVQRPRLGSVSPALTVSDGIVGRASSSSPATGACFFGPVDLDPSLTL